MELEQSFIALIEQSIKTNWYLNALTDYKGITLQYRDVARKIEKIHILLENVNLIEFPKRATLYVITVNLNNSSATKQLFYTLNGRLLQTRDVSYINPTLSPGIFEF